MSCGTLSELTNVSRPPLYKRSSPILNTAADVLSNRKPSATMVTVAVSSALGGEAGIDGGTEDVVGAEGPGIDDVPPAHESVETAAAMIVAMTNGA